MKLNDAKSIPESIGVHAFENYDTFSAYAKDARPALVKLLGLEDIIARKSPLRKNPDTIWSRDFGWGTVTKLSFEYEPGERGCTYFCIPAGAKPPYRVMICLQGHSTGMHNSIGVRWEDEITPLEIQGDRDFAIHCAKNGFAAMCVEMRYFGERSMETETRKSGCLLPTMQNIMLGHTTIGDRILDIDCIIDYLETREDVDHNFTGIMGNSGGGTAAMFAGAVLTGITHVMPSSSFSSFRGSIGSMKHCSCNYIPGLLRFGEAADVLGLIAPRPLVVVNGELDHIFPIEDARSQFERLTRIYAAAGAEKKLRHVIGPEGHRFYAELGFNALKEVM